VHYTGSNWVLEAPDAVTLRLRHAGGGMLTASMIYPASPCGSQPVTMGTVFGMLTADGQTLQASFCPASGGSTILVSVSDFSNGPIPFLFTCISTASNGHVCQRH
jgi:hypothetical protein